MMKLLNWYKHLKKQTKDSAVLSATIVGIISTVLSILGISLADFKGIGFFPRILIVLGTFLFLFCLINFIISLIFKKSITLSVRDTPITICCADIFQTPGMRVIACDTHFDTRIDDVIITKRSLHGQLFLQHGKIDEIKEVIELKAKSLGLHKNDEGLYDFPLGTIIRYESSVDHQTYLLLAMVELNQKYEARTNMAKFEQMLMCMWKEINSVYASHDVVLPILGTGILRFDDLPKKKEELLRCMLCTLNSSGVSFNSKVKIVIYGDNKEIPLYEYKSIFLY